ncbi:MAG: GNAT family N-acetyltransferase [Alphaproteobacteria bacterium]|nr:GNAT family N-acetyltransferase [Alphaproteobacteria bacterium]
MTDDKMFGAKVEYTPARYPKQLRLEGRHVTLAPLVAADAPDLQASFDGSTDHAIWSYLPYGPFEDAAAYAEWIKVNTAAGDPHFFTIRLNSTGQAVGVASYLRINPVEGSIEVGHINYAPSLQSTVAATETMFLMMRWAFEQGYRRYEWKCNALNRKSRAAAQRLGFSFEGVFRQASIAKGRNRDTAWFGIIDKEWPELKAAFERWLSDDNFDAEGNQLLRLSALTAPIRVASDPLLMD